MDEPQFSKGELDSEAERLYSKLGKLGWSMDTCKTIAPLTLEINKLKKEKNAVVLAHTYQTPDIIFGVADFVGDSYGLSVKAKETSAETIIFAGVRFMAETAKIINPMKRVFLPSLEAGCSLADGITAEDVRKLKSENPGVPVICYVNTSAEVKAEADICCTSANAEKIIRNIEGGKAILLPDEYMSTNVSERTGKEVIGWNARCVVHENFDEGRVAAFREHFPRVKILTHSECPPSVVRSSDMMGGTTDMEKYVSKSDADSFMLITECGLSERLRLKFPDKEFVGMCSLCPYMKKNSLVNILSTLQEFPKKNEISIPEEIARRAKAALDKMFEQP